MEGWPIVFDDTKANSTNQHWWTNFLFLMNRKWRLLWQTRGPKRSRNRSKLYYILFSLVPGPPGLFPRRRTGKCGSKTRTEAQLGVIRGHHISFFMWGHFSQSDPSCSTTLRRDPQCSPFSAEEGVYALCPPVVVVWSCHQHDECSSTSLRAWQVLDNHHHRWRRKIPSSTPCCSRPCSTSSRQPLHPDWLIPLISACRPTMNGAKWRAVPHPWTTNRRQTWAIIVTNLPNLPPKSLTTPAFRLCLIRIWCKPWQPL